MKSMPLFLRTVSIPLLIKNSLLGLILLLPFQINKLILAEETFFSGKFNPFTSVFLHIQEIIIIWIILLFGIDLWQKKILKTKNSIIIASLVGFFFLAAASSFNSEIPFISLLSVLKLIPLLILYLIFVQNYCALESIEKALIVSMSLQSLLSLWQYLSQKSLGLYFLGEPYIAVETSGLAKIVSAENIILRPYGTFAHPNILAGFLVISILLTLFLIVKKEKPGNMLWYPLFLLQTVALIFTFSRSGIIALMISLIVLIAGAYKTILPKKLGFSLAATVIIIALIAGLNQDIVKRFSIFTDNAVKERIEQSKSAFAIIKNHPLGVGLQSSTSNLPDLENKILSPWDFQPVHNLFLIISLELGVFGGLLLVFLTIYIFLQLIKKNTLEARLSLSILVAAAILSQFDHYLFTSFHGQILIIFLLFFFKFQPLPPK